MKRTLFYFLAVTVLLSSVVVLIHLGRKYDFYLADGTFPYRIGSVNEAGIGLIDEKCLYENDSLLLRFFLHVNMPSRDSGCICLSPLVEVLDNSETIWHFFARSYYVDYSLINCGNKTVYTHCLRSLKRKGNSLFIDIQSDPKSFRNIPVVFCRYSDIPPCSRK